MGTFAALRSVDAAARIIVALGLCHSIQIPTIFAPAIDGLGDDTKLGSSLLVMSIVGGAIIPAAMGALSDSAGIQAALWIPVVCYAVVLYFATIGHQHTARAAA